MCKWGTHKLIWVKIPADLSYTGNIRWKRAKIDSCIATLVLALQTAGINMRGSCCGHYDYIGDIQLQDGRSLLILDPNDTSIFYICRTFFFAKWMLKSLFQEIRWLPRYMWHYIIYFWG